jgi:hypothetical protein
MLHGINVDDVCIAFWDVITCDIGLAGALGF